MSIDLLTINGLIVILFATALAYALRVARLGRARFERVERQGSSVLLGKPVMEMAHWTLDPVARAFSFLKISPNQLSWSSLFFGAAAGGALAFGHFGVGATLAVISAFMDLLDGMLARKTGVASDAGEVLDAAIDRYVEFFYLFGLVIYYRPYPGFQVLALFALLGSFMVSYSTAKAEALRVVPPPGSMRRPERAVYLIGGAALSAWSKVYFETSQTTFPPVGLPMILALLFVALVSNVSSVLRFVAIAKVIRARE